MASSLPASLALPTCPDWQVRRLARAGRSSPWQCWGKTMRITVQTFTKYIEPLHNFFTTLR